MDGERVRSAAFLGVAFLVFVGIAWASVHWLGWRSTFLGFTSIMLLISALFRRVARAIFWVSVAIIIAAVEPLRSDEGGLVHWLIMVIGIAGMIYGHLADRAEFERRMNPYAGLDLGGSKDASDG